MALDRSGERQRGERNRDGERSQVAERRGAKPAKRVPAGEPSDEERGDEDAELEERALAANAERK
jgi:hypothetical protein